MALESMRRHLTPMEEEVEGGISEPTGPLAALGRASDMARIANMGPRPLEEADVSKPLPSEAVPVSESEMTAVRAAYARRGQNLPPHLRPKDIDQPIPVAAAPVKADVPSAVKTAIPATTATQPAPPADGSGGDDDVRNLYLARLAAQSAAGFGGMGAGKNIDMGIADTLGERMKQVEALRAKRQERQEGLEVERSQNEQTLNAYQAQFPELRETLEPLRGQTGKPAFQGLLRDIVAARKAKTGERALDIREQGLRDTAGYRAGTLGLRKDTLEANNQWRAVQAGLKQAEIDLKREESARKASGATEPSTKERNTFQAMIKPAESTAVALKDAANLDTISGGMLSTGKPPPFLTRSAIAQFNLGDAARGELAKSNPEAFDLLTEMARLKTMVGHEYFGSALSPSEAERQRQFLDFGMLDSPESVATKMKNYKAALANKASVFIRPRVVSHPLGAEWVQTSGLDAISGEGGTFAGLLDAPKAATPKAEEVKASAPVSAPAARKAPSARSIEELKKNADDMARQEFDEIFGPGAAAKALGE
jgi:hypothetical protein